jgi:hypothetical protein
VSMDCLWLQVSPDGGLLQSSTVADTARAPWVPAALHAVLGVLLMKCQSMSAGTYTT